MSLSNKDITTDKNQGSFFDR